MIPTYTIFQCSVCRRTKCILQDQLHASPNTCCITKACSGHLFPIGETTVFTATPPVAGLTDWYPRGQKPEITPAVAPAPPVDLSTSGSGVLTLGLNIPGSFSSPPPSVVSVLLSQQLTQNISYSEFIFNVASSTTTISGQDSNGKNLRFTVANVTAGLVFILVNGVASFPGTGWNCTIANTVTFVSALPAGTQVTILVYSQPPTFTLRLKFSLNQNLTLTENSGAWGNVRWVEEYDPTTGALKSNKWWMYSCSGSDLLSKSSRLSLLGVYSNVSPSFAASADVLLLPASSAPTDFSRIRFLLASPPYDNADRYLNFYIDGSSIGNEYALLTATNSITELFAESSALVEMFPPFQIIENTNTGLSSFVTPDTFPTSDSSSSTTILTGSKIIGPV